jgi:hypothetical protein
MNAKTKVATIECSTCAALLEVYPQNVPGEPSLGWDVLDDGELCKAPPLRRCPHARAEIKLRFPAFEAVTQAAGFARKIPQGNPGAEGASPVISFRERA